jgi:threonine dehydrogenase-like Zn-dependent dehydrogenase
MNLSFENKVAVVTGAASGIGLTTGQAFAAEGATCICGSDLWPYRGISEVAQPTPMGHEYCGIVEEVGREVRSENRPH